MNAMTISAARGPKATMSRVSRVLSALVASESSPMRRWGSKSLWFIASYAPGTVRNKGLRALEADYRTLSGA